MKERLPSTPELVQAKAKTRPRSDNIVKKARSRGATLECLGF